MNLLLEARKRLDEILSAREALLQKLVSEKRDATEAEIAQRKVWEAEEARAKDVIAEAEKLKQDRAQLDSATPESPAYGAVKVTREEGEDEKGDYRPFRNLGEQLQLIYRAGVSRGTVVDKRLLEITKRVHAKLSAEERAAAGLNEGVGAEGAFLLQTNFAELLAKQAFDNGALSSRCRRIPMSGPFNRMVIPVIDETSRADGSRWGGVVVYWVNEAEAPSLSKPKFGRLEIGLNKLMGLCVATEEMLADATFLGGIISQAFADEFGFMIDNAILRGTGVGQPLGILASPALITVAKHGSQTNTTLVGMNFVAMRGRFSPRSRANGVWFINQDCETQLPALSIVGNDGKSDLPVFQPATQLGGPYDRVLSMPVVPIEQASTLGAVGDVVLADLSQYLLVERQGLQAASSIHVYFSTEQQAFRFSQRVEGQPLWRAALTPAQGSNTVSPYVTLAGRP